MLRKTLALCALIFVSLTAFAAEPITQTISVMAAPLQAWKAFSVDWQVRQWSGANAAFFETRPEGPWRLTYSDGRIEEGIFSDVLPGEKLSYTFIFEDVNTKVDLTFTRTPTGTDIHIHHSNFGGGREGDRRRAELYEVWAEDLPKLSAYLDRIPGSYLARPYGISPYPAVLVLHDRFGLNNTTRDMCDSLSAKGYVALAVDMFKGDATSDPLQAARFLTLVNDSESVDIAKRGFDFLASDTTVNSRRIGVLGTGYGGSMAIHLGTVVSNAGAIVSWYGHDVPRREELQRISSPVYAIFTGADPANPPPDAQQFSQAMISAAVSAETILVQGREGFADPTYGDAYNAAAFSEAWGRTLIYLDRKMK